MAVSTKDFLEAAALQWPVTVSFEGGWFCVQSPVWGIAVGRDLDAACQEACVRSFDKIRGHEDVYLNDGDLLCGPGYVKEFLEYIIREGK